MSFFFKFWLKPNDFILFANGLKPVPIDFLNLFLKISPLRGFSKPIFHFFKVQRASPFADDFFQRASPFADDFATSWLALLLILRTSVSRLRTFLFRFHQLLLKLFMWRHFNLFQKSFYISIIRFLNGVSVSF